MTERTLFTGSNHQTLEKEAFAWATEHTQGGLARVLYLSESSNRHDRVEELWSQSYDTLTLRTETLVSFVFDCYETREGPSAQL